MNNGIVQTLARKEVVGSVQPARYSALRAAAETLSRRNADSAIVELLMEAMQRLTLLAYEQDAGSLCNVDPVTKRLLIPAPFGRAGHRKWGLSRRESEALRRMVRARQEQTETRPPGLWLYDRTRRSWRVNTFDFDSLADALAYWQRWPLTVSEYRHARKEL